MNYKLTYSLIDGVRFAKAVKTSTDLGDKLVDVKIDAEMSEAECTFEEPTTTPGE